MLNLCAIDDRNPCEFSILGRIGSRAVLLLRCGYVTPPTERSSYVFTFRLIMKTPDLREYALFALRNLLHNNSENQAVVNTFQADEHVGPDVVVRDIGAK